MPTIMVEDLAIDEKWIEENQKASMREAQEKLVKEHDEGEVDAFLKDYFTRHPFSDGIKKEKAILNTERIISVDPVNSAECSLPPDLLPECWKTQILYDDGKEGVQRRIRVSESVEEINAKIEATK